MEKLSVSILNLDFSKLENSLEELKHIGIERVHLDIIDTSFGDNISFGPGVINQILEYDFVFDLHLMLRRPLPILQQIDLEPIERVAVHRDHEDIARYLENKDPVAGYAISPSEPAPSVPVDYALVMTVEPGFGGQAFKGDCVYKIDKLHGVSSFIGVDGGVTKDNISLVSHADLIVVGSAIVNAADKEEYCRKLLSNMI